MKKKKRVETKKEDEKIKRRQKNLKKKIRWRRRAGDEGLKKEREKLRKKEKEIELLNYNFLKSNVATFYF